MSNNPLEGLLGGAGGPGGLDLGAMLQQAQQMQANLADAQKKLAESTVDGSVAGGAVAVTVTGVGDLAAVKISPDALEGTDGDALDDLGDLIVAAYRDARAKADQLAEELLNPVAGGLPGMPEIPDRDNPLGQLGFSAGPG